jgi:hypothetical protein
LNQIINKIRADKVKANQIKLANAYELIAHYENYEWFRTAIRAVKYNSKSKDEFGADDIWETLEGYPEPITPNSMGLVFKVCQKANLIEPSGNYRKTRRKNANGREIKMWRNKNEE